MYEGMEIKHEYPTKKEVTVEEDEAWYDEGDKLNEFYIGGG